MSFYGRPGESMHERRKRARWKTLWARVEGSISNSGSKRAGVGGCEGAGVVVCCSLRTAHVAAVRRYD